MLGRRFLILALSLASLCAFASPALAAPGAYKVLLAEITPIGAKTLGAQIATFPDVSSIDYINTGDEEGSTPTAAQLAPYDVVVSIGDSDYLDTVAWGNSLAAYVDGGGVVVQSAYDNWEDPEAFPAGRFSAGGYAPFIPGDNVNDPTSLGAFEAASPLMQGISSLTSDGYNTAPELAPGATLVAKWLTGANAVAFKGRVVSVTSYIGDGYGPGAWSGDYGRLVVNAVRTLGRQTLTVTNSTPAGGTVTSSVGGISCGAVCSAVFNFQTPVSLSAQANHGFAFAGFSGACAGLTCSLTMDSPKAVSASFSSFKFGKKVKLDKTKGTAKLSVVLGTPGQLLVSGKKVKKVSRSAMQAGKVTLPIAAKGKALAALKTKGKAKVKFNLAYTPVGGSAASLSKTVTLKLAD